MLKDGSHIHNVAQNTFAGEHDGAEGRRDLANADGHHQDNAPPDLVVAHGLDHRLDNGGCQPEAEKTVLYSTGAMGRYYVPIG